MNDCNSFEKIKKNEKKRNLSMIIPSTSKHEDTDEGIG